MKINFCCWWVKRYIPCKCVSVWNQKLIVDGRNFESVYVLWANLIKNDAFPRKCTLRNLFYWIQFCRTTNLWFSSFNIYCVVKWVKISAFGFSIFLNEFGSQDHENHIFDHWFVCLLVGLKFLFTRYLIYSMSYIVQL